jgi:beta-lactamase superfamily II metal-dependent hydrolase
MPHHGTEGCAPDVFFDRVRPKAALIPAPRELWLSERSIRMRTYLARHAIPAYVSGIHGHVTVTLTENAFAISAEGNSWPVTQ